MSLLLQLLQCHGWHISVACFYLSEPLLLQVEHPLLPDVLLHGRSSSSSSVPPGRLFTSSPGPPFLLLPFPFLFFLSWFGEYFAPRLDVRLLPRFTEGLLRLQLSAIFCFLSSTSYLSSLALLLISHYSRTSPLLSPRWVRLSLLLSSSSSRRDGLNVELMSSESLCSTRDTEERRSCQLCFLSLLCVATGVAELAGVRHCVVPPLLPVALKISLPLCSAVTRRPSLLVTSALIFFPPLSRQLSPGTPCWSCWGSQIFCKDEHAKTPLKK